MAVTFFTSYSPATGTQPNAATDPVPETVVSEYPDGQTPNDGGDVDAGPNNLQNFPVLSFAGVRGLDLDIELRPLALTKQQCVDLELPRIPIKDGDRGKRAFEERHGDGATELDALEALHPGLLEDLIVAEVERYHDHTLEERLREAEASVTADLMAINETVHPRNEDELEELRAELDSICEPLREVLRFRHFFRHAYAVELDRVKLRNVAQQVAESCPLVDRGLEETERFVQQAAEAAAE